jgi:hypothetical protein
VKADASREPALANGAAVNGRIHFPVGILHALLCATVFVGCEANLPLPKEPVDSLTDASSAYDAATAGEIKGQVAWAGPLPPESIPKIAASATPSSSCAASIRDGRGRGTWTRFASNCAIIKSMSVKETASAPMVLCVAATGSNWNRNRTSFKPFRRAAPIISR